MIWERFKTPLAVIQLVVTGFMVFSAWQTHQRNRESEATGAEVDRQLVRVRRLYIEWREQVECQERLAEEARRAQMEARSILETARALQGGKL